MEEARHSELAVMKDAAEKENSHYLMSHLKGALSI